ncbi:MAG: hypothetical protein HYZ01_06190 [Ignavibacteriales bacterium]|nr:hypothetical protein [Ignavibacteriales bacterium]
MFPYANLPPQQRQTQRLVDAFNADEAHWQSLQENRRRRRKLFKKLTKEQHRRLDLIAFEATRAAADCVG